MNQKKILIIGGGFGGLATALKLEKQNLKDAKVIFVSNKPHFEYHAALYRVVTGRSPLEVCIPMADLIASKNLEFVVDQIENVDLNKKIAEGNASTYPFDYLVLALGSETAYFSIPGLKEFSFGFKSIPEALRLKRHLHESFEACSREAKPDEKICLLHFVVVGAGASGVELAGELASYCKKLAREHNVDPSMITIQLIDGANHILPLFPKEVSEKVASRLRSLGVNVLTNRPMIKEEIEEIQVRGLSIKTETVIWTAGIKPNTLYQEIKGLQFDPKGKVLVDEYLQAQGHKNVFVIGDSAATQYAGMAQTAIYDGRFVAQNITAALKNKQLSKYQAQKPYYSLPVGPGWATTIIGPITFYGWPGWFFRRVADFRFFLSVLPFTKALNAFRSGKTLCETCEICLPEETSPKLG